MGAILLIIFLFVLTVPFLNLLQNRHRWFDAGLMNGLFWYHMLFALIYYIYVQSSASDSFAYYERTKLTYESWLAAYDTGTPFIDFVAYPFIHFLGFSYEMMMVLFAYMGFWGFVCFYIVYRENLVYSHYVWGMSLVTLIMFLPNMHYWTVSLGKGSIIFFGLGLSICGLSKLNSRLFALILGLALVYHVRPHVFFLMALGIVVGFITGRQRIPAYLKIMVLIFSAGALLLLYDEVLSFASLDKDQLLSSFQQLSQHRAAELAKSGSGMDISDYPLVFKLFTFWFRPLFIDSPGLIGIIVSFENLFYLFLAAKLISRKFIVFILKSSALVKVNAVIFLSISFALAGTLSNLGIIIRQKSMVMYFLLFIILCFMDYLKQRSMLPTRGAIKPVYKKAVTPLSTAV